MATRSGMVAGWAALVLGAGCASFPALDLRALPAVQSDTELPFEEVLDELEVVVTEEGGAPVIVEREHVQRRVLRAEPLPRLEASYSLSFEEPVRLEARTVLPDGTARPLDEKQRSDRPVSSAGILFSDERQVVWPVPPLPVGAVLEWRTTSTSRAPLLWSTRFRFGPQRTRRFRVSFDLPAAWTLETELLGTSDPGFLIRTESTTDGRRRLVFERGELPEAAVPPASPPAWAWLPTLQARLETWTEHGETKAAFADDRALSAWAGEREAVKAVPTSAIRELVREVLKNVPDEPRAKARALYEHTCRHVAYCAVEIGLGGWIPHSADEVHRLGAGDCKDKANYLKTLLSVAGIRSRTASIFAHDGTPAPFRLYGMGSFNHEILLIDFADGPVWADPTSRYTPFGQLPPRDTGAPSLPNDENGAALQKTPPMDPAEHRRVERYQLELGPQRTARGRYEVELSGAWAAKERARLRDGGKDSLEKAVQQSLGLVSASRVSLDAVPPDDFSTGARLSGRVETTAPVAASAGDAWLFRLDGLSGSELFLPEEDRTLDWVRPWRDTRATRFVLALPKGARVSRLPEPVSIDLPFASFRLAWREEGGALVAERELVWRQQTVGAADFPALRDFAAKVALAEADVAVVRLGGGK